MSCSAGRAIGVFRVPVDRDPLVPRPVLPERELLPLDDRELPPPPLLRALLERERPPVLRVLLPPRALLPAVRALLDEPRD